MARRPSSRRSPRALSAAAYVPFRGNRIPANDGRRPGRRGNVFRAALGSRYDSQRVRSQNSKGSAGHRADASAHRWQQRWRLADLQRRDFRHPARRLGAYGNSPLAIVSHDGFEVTGSSVVDGGTSLDLYFAGFQAGMKLVFTIDVDQVLFVDPQPGDDEVDAVDEGGRIPTVASRRRFHRPTLSGSIHIDAVLGRVRCQLRRCRAAGRRNARSAGGSLRELHRSTQRSVGVYRRSGERSSTGAATGQHRGHRILRQSSRQPR